MPIVESSLCTAADVKRGAFIIVDGSGRAGDLSPQYGKQRHNILLGSGPYLGNQSRQHLHLLGDSLSVV